MASTVAVASRTSNSLPSPSSTITAFHDSLLLSTMSDERPTSVIVIGWLWIIYAGLKILFAGSGAAYYAGLLNRSAPVPDVGVLGWSFVGVQVVFCAVGVWAGWLFLGGRARGRTILEILTWLGLLYMVGESVYSLTSLFGWSEGQQFYQSSPGYYYYALAQGMLIEFILVPIPAIVLYYLRSDHVRASMDP